MKTYYKFAIMDGITGDKKWCAIDTYVNGFLISSTDKEFKSTFYGKSLSELYPFAAKSFSYSYEQISEQEAFIELL